MGQRGMNKRRKIYMPTAFQTAKNSLDASKGRSPSIFIPQDRGAYGAFFCVRAKYSATPSWMAWATACW